MLHLNPPDFFFKILILIEVLFFIGGSAIFIICSGKPKTVKHHQWLKFLTYFIIVHVIIFTALQKALFVALGFAISTAGLIEIVILVLNAPLNVKRAFFIVSIYCGVTSLFIGFCIKVDTYMVLSVYLIVAVFDAFSQITGQLFGRHKLAPSISPNKTIEGALGGLFSATLLSAGLHCFISHSIINPIQFGAIIAISSLTGDLMSSKCKRLYNVKDFSRALPGQGGIIDRFNSFIPSAAIIFLITRF